MERLDKVLAATGRWSRREVKQLVRQGQVRVNGAAAASAEEKVEPETAVITVGGEPVRLQKYTYVMLHKPAGVLTATEDRRQPTVSPATVTAAEGSIFCSAAAAITPSTRTCPRRTSSLTSRRDQRPVPASSLSNRSIGGHLPASFPGIIAYSRQKQNR